MYTSDTDNGGRTLLRHAAADLGGALFLALFGAVYEYFSFGVYSVFMVYAFVFPLLAGLLLLLAVIGRKRPSHRTMFLLQACTAALAVGSVAAGIIRISGRENLLLLVYPLIGAALGIAAGISFRKDHK